MKAVAVIDCKDIYTGLRLVGLETYLATTQEEFAQILTTLSDVGVLVVAKKFECDSLNNFLKSNPHVLSIFL